jgi:ethanolamine utilization protein EutP (predicted NTPase)
MKTCLNCGKEIMEIQYFVYMGSDTAGNYYWSNCWYDAISKKWRYYPYYWNY